MTALAGCWVNPDWASGLTVDGHPAWPGLPPAAYAGPAGLVTIVTARERGGSKVSACAYLVDVYCLGACAGHLGEWQGPSMIGFGYQGKPQFIQGPNDDAARIMKKLNRTAGRGGFDFIAPA